MRLPELKEGMVIKCLASNVDWWTEGKDYPVSASSSNVEMVIFDNDLHTRGSYEDLEGNMIFEVIEPKPPWSGKGYPPVGIDCMVHHGAKTPSVGKVDFIGKTHCIYTVSGVECTSRLNHVSFTPIKTNRQEAIDSIVGNDFTSKALAADLVDEIIAGKHKWLEFTGGD